MNNLIVKVLNLLVICVIFASLVLSYPADKSDGNQALGKTVVQLAKRIHRLQTLGMRNVEKIERKFLQLEREIDELKRKEWGLKRVKYSFPDVQKVQIGTYSTLMLQLPNKFLPKNTKAVFFAIKCDVWRETFGASMKLSIKQDGNDQQGEIVYDAPINDFYYETAIPWNSTFGNAVTVSIDGTSKNLYTMSVTGYIKG